MKKWVKTGLTWGVTMFLMIVIVFPWFQGKEITVKSVVVGIILWGIGGILFGFTMRKRFEEKN
ncbi:hypothetical protein [Tenacibaculum sp. 47A_GOM-205m]|uniref:hypothetical protein n=1 Tax=Tenacibaculum sp. 47A_GOM-205m TaxID=1380384 RepID=UPI00048F00C2|nr:hypothetical protein [Tenacibaculum sp. 47A_GOM-205m]